MPRSVCVRAEGEVLSTEDANAMQWFLPNVIDNWADKPTD